MLIKFKWMQPRQLYQSGCPQVGFAKENKINKVCDLSLTGEIDKFEFDCFIIATGFEVEC